MNKGYQAMLGAIMALPFLCVAGTASAAPPNAGHYIYVPPGATVVVLPASGVAAAPIPFPIDSVIAQQEAMVYQMIADIDAMMAAPMPDPHQLMQAAMRGASGIPGAGVILTSIGSGDGVCSETITYVYPADGGAPQVHVTHSGNACGTMTMQGQAQPIAAPSTPRAMPNAVPQAPKPRMWTASDPARPVGPADPRT